MSASFGSQVHVNHGSYSLMWLCLLSSFAREGVVPTFVFRLHLFMSWSWCLLLFTCCTTPVGVSGIRCARQLPDSRPWHGHTDIAYQLPSESTITMYFRYAKQYSGASQLLLLAPIRGQRDADYVRLN
jgi:hypothetical protein